MKDEPETPIIVPTAEALLESIHDRELRIAADVFNPNETDEQYFRRRLALLQASQN